MILGSFVTFLVGIECCRALLKRVWYRLYAVRLYSYIPSGDQMMQGSIERSLQRANVVSLFGNVIGRS